MAKLARQASSDKLTLENRPMECPGMGAAASQGHRGFDGAACSNLDLCLEAETVRLQISKDLFSYWNELRGDRAAPDRCRIDPCAIRHLLADTFIVEADDACAFPFRLSGSRINALWLREHKGASFVELWRKEDRRELMVALSALVDEASPFVAAATAHAAAGARVEFELLLLPLRNFGETHARVLGALSPVGALNRIGRTPPGPLELVPLRAIEVKKADSERSPMRPIPRNPAGRYPRLVVYNG